MRRLSGAESGEGERGKVVVRKRKSGKVAPGVAGELMKARVLAVAQPVRRQLQVE